MKCVRDEHTVERVAVVIGQRSQMAMCTDWECRIDKPRSPDEGVKIDAERPELSLLYDDLYTRNFADTDLVLGKSGPNMSGHLRATTTKPDQRAGIYQKRHVLIATRRCSGPFVKLIVGHRCHSAINSVPIGSIAKHAERRRAARLFCGTRAVRIDRNKAHLGLARTRDNNVLPTHRRSDKLGKAVFCFADIDL